MLTLESLYELPEGFPFEEEYVEVLLDNDEARVERIISSGQASPEGFWYDQDEVERVVLLQGEAVLAFEEGTETLRAGSSRTILAHEKHRILSTSKEPPCIWVCIFYK